MKVANDENKDHVDMRYAIDSPAGNSWIFLSFRICQRLGVGRIDVKATLLV